MGYTIYYRNEKKNAKKVLQDPKRFKAFKAEFLQVMEIFNIPERDYNAEHEYSDTIDEYASNASDVCVYGIRENECYVWGSHESFNFPVYKERSLEYGGDPTFNFTKTAEKSYDALVKVLFLLGVKHYGGGVDHDGDPETYLDICKDAYSESDKEAMIKCLTQFHLLGYLPLEDEELEAAI